MKARTDFVSNSSSSSFVVPNYSKIVVISKDKFIEFFKSLFKKEFVDSGDFDKYVKIFDRYEIPDEDRFKGYLKANGFDEEFLNFIDEFEISDLGKRLKEFTDMDYLLCYKLEGSLPEKRIINYQKKYNEFFKDIIKKYGETLKDAWLSMKNRFIIHMDDGCLEEVMFCRYFNRAKEIWEEDPYEYIKQRLEQHFSIYPMIVKGHPHLG